MTRKLRPPMRSRSPERVVGAEQLLLQLGAEHDEAARLFRALAGQELAHRHLHVEHRQRIGRHAVDDGAAQRGRAPATSALPQTVGTTPTTPGTCCSARASSSVSGRTEVGSPRRRAAARRRAPGRDADDVGAELRELAEHEAVDALADGGQQDHRGDAHRDAEQREKAAQALRGDRAPGEARRRRRRSSRVHRFASAVTGSSRAARRAGSTPNSRPVNSAVPRPASTAQSGG